MSGPAELVEFTLSPMERKVLVGLMKLTQHHVPTHEEWPRIYQAGNHCWFISTFHVIFSDRSSWTQAYIDSGCPNDFLLLCFAMFRSGTAEGMSICSDILMAHIYRRGYSRGFTLFGEAYDHIAGNRPNDPHDAFHHIMTIYPELPAHCLTVSYQRDSMCVDAHGMVAKRPAVDLAACVRGIEANALVKIPLSEERRQLPAYEGVVGTPFHAVINDSMLDTLAQPTYAMRLLVGASSARQYPLVWGGDVFEGGVALKRPGNSDDMSDYCEQDHAMYGVGMTEMLQPYREILCKTAREFIMMLFGSAWGEEELRASEGDVGASTTLRVVPAMNARCVDVGTPDENLVVVVGGRRKRTVYAATPRLDGDLRAALAVENRSGVTLAAYILLDKVVDKSTSRSMLSLFDASDEAVGVDAIKVAYTKDNSLYVLTELTARLLYVRAVQCLQSLCPDDALLGRVELVAKDGWKPSNINRVLAGSRPRGGLASSRVPHSVKVEGIVYVTGGTAFTMNAYGNINAAYDHDDTVFPVPNTMHVGDREFVMVCKCEPSTAAQDSHHFTVEHRLLGADGESSWHHTDTLGRGSTSSRDDETHDECLTHAGPTAYVATSEYDAMLANGPAKVPPSVTTAARAILLRYLGDPVGRRRQTHGGMPLDHMGGVLDA